MRDHQSSNKRHQHITTGLACCGVSDAQQRPACPAKSFPVLLHLLLEVTETLGGSIRALAELVQGLFWTAEGSAALPCLLACAAHGITCTLTQRVSSIDPAKHILAFE